MSNFDDAFQYVLGDEGGYTNDPHDRGGPTNWGITQSDLAQWRRRPVSAADVKAMPKLEAKAIYKARYWDTLSLDQIVDGKRSCAIFDIGVVRGIMNGAKTAQRTCCALGHVIAVDGHFGPMTVAAVNACDHVSFIKLCSADVERQFRGIVANNPSQGVFLKGWINRAHHLLTLI